MTDYDSPWKMVLDGLFKQCLELFFPELAAALDWSRPYESLEQELRSIASDAEIGLKIVDKLVKAWRLDGSEEWLLVHLEVQNQRVQDFAERMFTSYYRIRDNYGVFPVSLAVLGDAQEQWRPDQFLHERYSCSLTFKFPMVKLSDFALRRVELETSPNPFARVVLAHLATQQTRGDPAHRYVEKVSLVKNLLMSGWSKTELEYVLRFIDWLMQLPSEMQKDCRLEITEFERGAPVPYITSFERIARQEGREEGRLEGIEKGIEKGRNVLRSGIRRLWVQRFPSAAPEMFAKLDAVTDVDKLEQLLGLSLDGSLPDIEKQLS